MNFKETGKQMLLMESENVRAGQSHKMRNTRPIFQMRKQRPSKVKSLTQVAPVSPPHYMVHESRILPVVITAEPQKGPGI